MRRSNIHRCFRCCPKCSALPKRCAPELSRGSASCWSPSSSSHSLALAAGSAAPNWVPPAPPGPTINLGSSRGSGSTKSTSNSGSNSGSDTGSNFRDSRGSHDALLREGAEDGPGEGDNHRGRVNHHRGVGALPDTGLVAGVGHGLGHGHPAGGGAAVGAGAQGVNHGSGVGICGAREEQENKTQIHIGFIIKHENRRL